MTQPVSGRLELEWEATRTSSSSAATRSPRPRSSVPLVAAGLTSGITLVDTTYRQARLALERDPRELDRRMDRACGLGM
jgi:hypothetical protein